MAFFVDEQRMIEDNIFQFEEKLKAPTTRFLDTTPTFVTYFQIVNNETTTDEGYQDVASFIGAKSPVRYKKIENFPIYGIEQIVLQLQNQDHGLDSEFSGEGTILPGTLKPLENEYFIIPILHDAYMFRITSIAYDTVLPDNFYKIGFILEYIDEEQIHNISKQVTEEYTCVLENIGTDDRCLIEKSCYEKIREIDVMYNDMVQTYLALFYNEKHNCLLGEYEDHHRLYDPLMNVFVNKHSLFNRKKDLKTLIFTDQWSDPKRRLKYEKSVYRFIERRDLSLINNFYYYELPGGSFHESTFYRWVESNIFVLDIPEDGNMKGRTPIFSNEFITCVKINGPQESEYGDLIQKFIRKNATIYDISMDLNEELIYLNGSIEVFFFSPIIMYIIKELIHEKLGKK